MPIYLVLVLASVSVPFFYSFHPKLKLYKKWRFIFPAIFFTMIYFIVWDVVFTKYGIWGFNESYHSSIEILHLPLEEWLFFICIPYACVFTHYALLYYLPNTRISQEFSHRLTIILGVLLFCVALLFRENAYTFVNFLVGSFWLVLVNKFHPKLLQQYYLTFLVMIIPFLLVNGTLTGSFIENEVVWYNNDENLGIRVFTIPVEDFVYAFSMVLSSLFITEKLEIFFESKTEFSRVS